MTIRLVLVEDHILMREGLKQLFMHISDIEVCAETSTSFGLINLLSQQKFDLILLDVSMPGVDTFDLAHRITQHAQHPPILILSMHKEMQMARRMFKLGAMGYITKNCTSEELISAVRKVAGGGRYIDTELGEQLFFESNTPAVKVNQKKLTKRQIYILKLFVKGKTITEIAHALNLSVKTVSTHKVNIKQKMNINSDVELIRFALANEQFF